MAALNSMAELTSLLEQWDRQSSSGSNPTITIQKMADLVEKETEEWYKMDPDPFDDRHPGRADPNCALGHLLKTLFKNENFMNKLINTYLVGNTHRDDHVLHTHACRLLLDLMPGLEATVVFQDNEGLVRKLMNWAQTADDPLKTYAVGLLGGAMELQEIAANYKEGNAALVPSMLKKLHELMKASQNETLKVKEFFNRPFKDIGSEFSKPSDQLSTSHAGGGDSAATVEEQNDGPNSPPLKRMRRSSKVPGVSWRNADDKDLADIKSQAFAECSNSSWNEMSQYMIGTYSMWPLSIYMQQRLILQYITSMGEYQEHLSHVFEHHGMDLIFYYIDLNKNKDVRLAFEATKTLAALLCHKKFAVEFINVGGVEKLLDVHRPSVAATGASMCLYYLAYFEDTMERVCLLPQQVLANMVSYVLWLLECSHESGRSHASMFFGMAFPFRVILELFDRQDGLRKLYNVASTLQLFTSEGTDSIDLSDDDVFTNRQTARHVCITLKKYFEAHLAIKADQLRRSHLRGEGGSPLADIPAYKASKFPPEVIRDNIKLLLECLPLKMRWDPVSEFIKLGGIHLLLQLVAMAAEWNAYTGKAETIRSALDVLTVCSVTPRVQLLLCDAIPIPDTGSSSPAISIILGLAEGDILPDPEVQKSSLNVLINCVCGPTTRYSNSNIAKIVGGSAKKKNTVRKEEELLLKLWENVRANNGIMVLLKLLTIKTPITEADSIRAFACKALVGLVRCDTVKQIISKLPLSSGQLQQLMKEPVLQDKRQEHLKFCKYANEVIEQLSGKASSSTSDGSLDKIRRADVVAQTKIVYHEKELLQLLHDHLMAKGLGESAAMLQREADLPRSCSTPPPIHPASPHIYATPTSSRMMRQMSSPSTSGRLPSTPAFSNTDSAASTPQGPIKINIISSKVNQSPAATNQARLQQSKKIIIQKRDYTAQAGVGTPSMAHKFPAQKADYTMSLDKIVTEYLREQHATCHNPVVTCPTFSLLNPHRCPEPRHRNYAPSNVTTRLIQRSHYPCHGGPDGMKCNRKFVYSRFRPIRSYRDQDEDGCFSCCAFNAVEDCLILGTYAGEIKVINISTSEELGNYVVHNSPVTHCEPSRDGNLLLTGSTWGEPLSALWSMTSQFEEKLTFEYDNYVEFSKQAQDMIIGTKKEVAHVYDVATGNRIRVLDDLDKANNYSQNRATFNYTDDLVLNDGVLWDMNIVKPIHKFDKFNQNFSGVFHPKGMEVIINSEVWDLRTFKLLYTVTGLDQCSIRFNNAGDVIYGAIHQFDDESEMEESTIKSPFGSSFRTFDGTDYSNIATIDVKKNIFDMCTDSSDCYLAVVENQRVEETLSDESVCRLYAVGRQKEVDDEEDDDENHDDEEEEDDGADDDDDDDDDLDDDDDDMSSDDDEEEEDANNVEENRNNEEGDNNEDDNEADETGDVDEEDESDLDSVDTDSGDDDEDMDNFLFELSDLSNF